MSNNPYLIKVASQKGGVGKTTISVNLATILQELGNSVLLIDFDVANPSVGFHLGIENQNVGLDDVLKGKARIETATVLHAPTGLRIIPGNIRSSSPPPTSTQLAKFVNELRRTNYNFIIFDTAPGYLVPELVDVSNEAIIITTPELSSCTSCIRLANSYRKHNLKSQLVINRVKNKRYELHIKEIEEMYGSKAAAVIPEDEVVPESIAMHVPAYLKDKKSAFSKAILELSRFYSLKTQDNIRTKSFGLIGLIKRLLGIN